MAMLVHSYTASAAFLVLSALGASFPKYAFADQSALLTPHAQSLCADTALLKSGDLRGAITAFEEFLELNKQYGSAYLNLGLTYHSLKHPEQTISSLTKALELDDQLASTALFLGIEYCKTNLHEETIEPLQRALALEPGDTNPHLWVGRALLGKSLYKKATLHREKAPTVYPEGVGIQYDLVKFYHLLSEQISENNYRKDPHSYWAHLLRARA
jgi:tetratricopeptide (TPR) repeat protein